MVMIVGLIRISISQHPCFSYNHMHNSKIVPVNIEDKIYVSSPSVKDHVAYQWIKHPNIAFITSHRNTMISLHLLTSSSI